LEQKFQEGAKNSQMSSELQEELSQIKRELGSLK